MGKMRAVCGLKPIQFGVGGNSLRKECKITNMEPGISKYFFQMIKESTKKCMIKKLTS